MNCTLTVDESYTVYVIPQQKKKNCSQPQPLRAVRSGHLPSLLTPWLPPSSLTLLQPQRRVPPRLAPVSGPLHLSQGITPLLAARDSGLSSKSPRRLNVTPTPHF